MKARGLIRGLLGLLLAASATPALAGWGTVAQVGTPATCTNGGAIQCTLTGVYCDPGSLLLVGVSTDSYLNVPTSMTDDAGDAFAPTAASANRFNIAVRLFYAKNLLGLSNQNVYVNFASNSGNRLISAICVATTSAGLYAALDAQSAGANGTTVSSAWTMGPDSLAPSTTSDLLVGIASIAGNASTAVYGADTLDGWTKVVDYPNTNRLVMSVQTPASTSSVSWAPTAHNGGSGQHYAMTIVAFRQASGASGTGLLLGAGL